MFVTKGAKEKIMEKRKEEFYDNFIKKLLVEATRLGIGQNELLNMIQKNN